jgi:hypothetical protein
MTRLGWMVVLGVLAVCALIAGIITWMHGTPPVEEPIARIASTSPEVDPSELSIYTSGEYGFSLFYPSIASVSDAYTESSTSPQVPWRTHATATGTSIVRLKQDAVEVRVGISTDEKEVTDCTRPSANEEARGTFAVGDVPWQEFMFEKLGTDNEVKVVSYRIVRENACYAVEVFGPLDHVPQKDQYSLQDIITSFSFAS